MFKRIRNLLFGVLGALVLLAPVQAQTLAQEPLLTRSTPVEPNIVFMFDDSSSMPGEFMYQFGGNPGVYGMSGPDCNSAPCSLTTLAARSPQINKMAYDPRVRYRTRINGTGTASLPNASTATTGAFRVYFYKGTYPAPASSYPQSWTTPTLSIGYHSPSYTATVAEVVAGNTRTYPQLTTSSVATYPKFVKRTDCQAATYCTWAEERQNRANWDLYHNSRLELAITGIGLAFQNLGPTFRLGWGRINSLDAGTVTSTLDSGVSLFSTATKASFYTWLNARTGTNNSTPNRQALNAVGTYYTRRDSDGPWGTTPRATSTGVVTPSTVVSAEAPTSQASCRRSYAMLMTDGYYNDSSPISTNNDNVNGPNITLPNGVVVKYIPDEPYRDSHSGSLADVAQKFFYSDLRTDLPNNVPAVTGVNEAVWQSLSFYAIGLGVYGTLPQSTTTIAQLTSNAISWPTPTTNDPRAIDDLWHATLNSRGQFLSAGNAEDLNDAIESMMAQINRITSSQSGVAVSTANLISGTRKYIPQYTTGAWTGNVIARNLDAFTGAETSTAWQSSVPPHATRNIAVWNSTGAVTFTHTVLVNTGLANSMTGTVTAALVNYLRGDATEESDVGLYRIRESRLGDIVNSSPVFVKAGLDFKYQSLPAATFPSAGSAYAAFITAKKARSEGVLFVGANDGMLHAFRDSDGAEIFGFVPRTSLPNMHQLASKTYQHRYFVDGPNIETDAFWGGAWKNLVVGTAGAGGKSVFALDVTNPMAMDQSKVLWEVNPGTPNFTELGHVLSDVQAGPTMDGSWAAVFGNGYGSPSGTARLFVVNLQTGTRIAELNTAVGGTNGLGGVRILRDAQQRIIGAYGGDLKGNMWKFDMSDTSPSNWKVSLSGSPLFAAGATRPITAAPSVIPHTDGFVIAFGTGKFFENSDLTTTSVQTMYGVLDSLPFGTTGLPPLGYALTNTTTLVMQTVSTNISVTRTTTAIDGSTSTESITYFAVSRNPIDWATKRGWYFNLPASGQRLVYPVERLATRFIVVDTISPSNAVVNACQQGGQGTGYLYIIDAWSGGTPDEAILDTNGDGNVDSSDAIVGGLTGAADNRNTQVLIESRSDATQQTYASLGGGSTKPPIIELSCRLLQNCASPTVKGIKTREWRQLFMR